MNDLVTYGQGILIPFEESDQWRRALAVWLSGKRDNTRRAYLRITADFFQFVGGATPNIVNADHVTAWKMHLQQLGRKDTTIAQRLSGLSSFFDHLTRAGLLTRNPVDRVERRDLDDSPYGNAKPLTMAEFNLIWSELDGRTPAGALYRALALAYTLTGRRRSELLRLRGGDLIVDGDTVKYRVLTKGGKTEYRTMPPAVWAEVANYLRVTGRTLADNEPVFVATHVTAGYIAAGGRYVQRSAGDGAISGTAVTEALKRAAGRAGVNPDRVTIHGMRHLAAKLWKKAHGNDIRGLQTFLGHANVATTQVYDEVMSGDERTDYDAMAAALFAGATMPHT